MEKKESFQISQAQLDEIFAKMGIPLGFQFTPTKEALYMITNQFYLAFKYTSLDLHIKGRKPISQDLVDLVDRMCTQDLGAMWRRRNGTQLTLQHTLSSMLSLMDYLILLIQVLDFSLLGIPLYLTPKKTFPSDNNNGEFSIYYNFQRPIVKSSVADIENAYKRLFTWDKHLRIRDSRYYQVKRTLDGLVEKM
ncbi:hypothetical protein FGO68_gene2599 [Halteria grandinella]|uniref:Uncharacterized protein n=1 Tax=Halteria grandinella TaxID=5974 RepID=A0A8J8T0C4_HALGN|nr:hypothetical protein FGO68_gene2599 [Halteria grandinella]